MDRTHAHNPSVYKGFIKLEGKKFIIWEIQTTLVNLKKMWMNLKSTSFTEAKRWSWNIYKTPLLVTTETGLCMTVKNNCKYSLWNNGISLWRTKNANRHGEGVALVIVFVVSRLRNAKSVSSQVIWETWLMVGVTFF